MEYSAQCFDMVLHNIRGGSESELYSKRYNIGVGVSLGNKWFTTENTVGLIQWSLLHTRERVIVYVADSIHAINVEVRSRISSEKALSLAKSAGLEHLRGVKQLANVTFSEADQKRIIYATWDDLCTEAYREKVKFLYRKFSEDQDFATAIKTIVRNWVSKEARTFSEADINKFATYILEELPECLLRVPIKGEVCDAYAYPYDGELPELVEMMQSKNIFPEIMETIADTPAKVLLVVR